MSVDGERHAWIDATAGIAGDMLLGALVDAGADLRAVSAAIERVIPGSVRLERAEVSRAAQRSTKIDVILLVDDPPHRSWGTIRTLIQQAGLEARTHDRALGAFERLARAEARVHGIPVDEVHFHEVGALDSIADVVGVCAALQTLQIGSVSGSEVAVGSGSITAAHGRLPVPVPAVADLARGWTVTAGGTGELATPTGMALLRTLADSCEPLPRLALDAVGVGAGTRDRPDRPNVVRVLIGRPAASSPQDATEAQTGRLAQQKLSVLEANIDDLDPRLWPGVLNRLIDAGAADAWLVPILMKKGRPAHILSVLCRPEQVHQLREIVFAETTTLGVRHSDVHRSALARAWLPVAVDGGTVQIKIGHRNGTIQRVTPEFSSVEALAQVAQRPVSALLEVAALAARAAGIIAGAPLPDGARSDHHVEPGGMS